MDLAPPFSPLGPCAVLCALLAACTPPAPSTEPAATSSPPVTIAPPPPLTASAAAPAASPAASSQPFAVSPPAPPDTATLPPLASSPATFPQTNQARICRNGERLDHGCLCPQGACFDICCGPNAGCAHPLHPGGPSACMMRMPSPPPSPPPRGCTDGELLSSGCQCPHACMDICCVGSICTHHESPEGGSSKCMKKL